MEKDKIFFGSEGLTSTSANHLANLAKEMYLDIEKELNAVTFITTEVGLLGSSEKNTLKEGVPEDFLNTVCKRLMTIADLKQLIAWLREAIKAKENLISEARGLSDKECAEALGLTIPESPEHYLRQSEDDIVATWNIKQRNQYYYLDTLCSTIGKYIHPDGPFSKAKDNLIKAMSEKHSAEGQGRDTVIYTMTPTVFLDSVNHTFFELQSKYRGYQAQLNSMKHTIETAMQQDDREKSTKELLEFRDYQNEYRNVLENIVAYRKDKIAEAQNLKIVIPDSLRETYEMVNEIG